MLLCHSENLHAGDQEPPVVLKLAARARFGLQGELLGFWADNSAAGEGSDAFVSR